MQVAYDTNAQTYDIMLVSVNNYFARSCSSGQ